MLRVLKGQPLTFLHVFHHAVVLTMAYGVRSPRLTRTQPHPRAADASAAAAQWLEFAQSLQVVALLTNTGIHVIMCARVADARRRRRLLRKPRADVAFAQVLVLPAVLRGAAPRWRSESLCDQQPDRAVPLQARALRAVPMRGCGVLRADDAASDALRVRAALRCRCRLLRCT